ncbi:MAG: trans-aconitate 2-methyltransferase [Methylobacteriaceae bacterium]|nr:trans-aconitate 2-methyltransferase [Methylobacteriaceae bacterium]
MADWSATQYLKFSDERTRPALDLLARVPLQNPGRCVDLGCGPGNSTELLGARFPDASITGLDNSPDMLAAARKRLPHVRFDQADLVSWAPQERYDLIFANAVLHWLPGHEMLFPRLASLLNAGGCLAVQMPDNLDEPSHVLMREVAQAGPWAEKLAAAAGSRAEIGSFDDYYRWLAGTCASVDLWRTVYLHALSGPTAIVEWVKGTGLRPFIDPLDETERRDFLARYEEAIAAAYPPQADGKVLLPFPRLFVVARKP